MHIDTSKPMPIALPPAVANHPENNLIAAQMVATPMYMRDSATVNALYQKNMRLLSDRVEVLKPTAQAHLPAEGVLNSKTALLIDDTFIANVRNYRAKLLEACLKDGALAQINQAIPNATIKAVAISTVRFINKAPNVPVIKQVAIPFLALIGSLAGLFKKKKISQELKQISNSKNRQLWSKEVAVLEKQRIESSLRLISQRTENIHREIQQGDLLDVGLLEELKILNSLHAYFEQGVPLIIDGKTIPNFLEEIQQAMQQP